MDLIAGAASSADMGSQVKPGMTARKRLSAKRRHASATVRVGGKDKYPIPDKAHAKAALARIDQAKPSLTAAQKARVRKRAYAVLGNGNAGDGRLERPAPRFTRTEAGMDAAKTGDAGMGGTKTTDTGRRATDAALHGGIVSRKRRGHGSGSRFYFGSDSSEYPGSDF